MDSEQLSLFNDCYFRDDREDVNLRSRSKRTEPYKFWVNLSWRHGSSLEQPGFRVGLGTKLQFTSIYLLWERSGFVSGHRAMDGQTAALLGFSLLPFRVNKTLAREYLPSEAEARSHICDPCVATFTFCTSPWWFMKFQSFLLACNFHPLPSIFGYSTKHQYTHTQLYIHNSPCLLYAKIRRITMPDI